MSEPLKPAGESIDPTVQFAIAEVEIADRNGDTDWREEICAEMEAIGIEL